MTSEELRAEADRQQAEAEAAIAAGDPEHAGARARLAALFRRAAAELDGVGGLPPDESSAKVQPVTDAQLARRGRAIAKGKAGDTKDRLWRAILNSEWGSQERYARDRLRLSPASLSSYRHGVTSCPREIADLVRLDFGIGHDYWPAGVVD